MSNIAELVFTTNTLEPDFTGIVEMTPEEWIAVQDNPRQRDTATRAKRAKHLRAPHPTHSRVNVARLPTGELYKLDGHTRAYLWAHNALEAPSKVRADLWSCSSIEQVKALYGTFDSKAAVETVPDQVFGSVRESGVSFESELLKSQRFTNAMRIASELLFGTKPALALSTYDVFEYWLPELKLLDTCSPTRKRFHGGVCAAALITLRRYGPLAVQFWKTFAIGGGIKLSGEMDAVQALEERMDSMRTQRTGRGNAAKTIRVCLSAYEAYERNATYQVVGGGIKALQDNSFNRWLTIAAKTTRRW